ncbi:MAG TPA: phage major capsid protein [Saccharospirillum sp.]|nr:phage major capsid protein [Saccharospirillum sp.]
MLKTKEITHEQSIAARRYCEANGLDFVSASNIAAREEWGDLHAQKKACHKLSTTILNAAEDEGRDLTENEAQSFEYFSALANNINRELDIRMENGSKEPRRGGGDLVPTRFNSVGRSGNGQSGRDGGVRVLAKNEPMATGFNTSRFDLGDVVKQAVFGNEASGFDAEFAATNEIGTPSLGGYTVPEVLSSQIIDRARNQSRVIQAGAMTVPMQSSTLKMAKLNSDPQGYWRAENAAITESDLVFDQVTFEAKALAALVRVSIELMEDSPNFSQLLEESLSAALALELDRVALMGSGTGSEPLGVFNATGIQGIDLDAALTGYGPMSQAVTAVKNQNAEPGAFVLAPRTEGELDQLVDSQGQPLRPPRSVADREQLTTNQVPTNLGVGTNESAVFVGDWRNLMIGMRTNLIIEATRAGDADTFGKMQVLVRAYMRADIQLARPEHFAVIRGITPPA